MFIDSQLMFSDAQVLTATAVSTNLIDLGAVRQIGQGEPISLLITIDTGADITTGDETYSVSVQTDDNSAFSSQTTIQTNTIVAADIALNKTVQLGFPVSKCERFVRLNYTLGGTTPSVTLTAVLQPSDMVALAPQYYPRGYVVS